MPENLREELARRAADENRLGVEEIARKAGLHDMYVVIYPVLSPAVHSSVGDMEAYFILDAEGREIEGFRLQPSDSDTEPLIRISGSLLLTTLAAAANVFQADVKDRIATYSGTYDNALRPLDDESGD